MFSGLKCPYCGVESLCAPALAIVPVIVQATCADCGKMFKADISDWKLRSWNDEDFAKEFEIDEEAKTIKPRPGTHSWKQVEWQRKHDEKMKDPEFRKNWDAMAKAHHDSVKKAMFGGGSTHETGLTHFK